MGKIIAGALAPHPPHLVYGENPPQNEAKSECGWEVLRWGYESLRGSLDKLDYDVLVVHSPHWKTQTSTHFLGVPNLKSLSVDPVFPNLFRYNYDMNIDVDLAESMYEESKALGLPVEMMTNKSFRVDYGSIVSLHMTNPTWNKPVVVISSQGGAQYYNMHVMQEIMTTLGKATKKAIEASAKKAVLLASHSLSHRHFVEEPEIPEDMSKEYIYNHGQYIWDMKMIELMKKGHMKEFMEVLPDFTEMTEAETHGGGLIWMMSAMGIPDYPAKVHAYGTVIGTGNAVVEWQPSWRNA